MNRPPNCQIHRFHGEVAISLGGETVYLSPDFARQIADKLHLYANDVDGGPFVDSSLGTCEIDAKARTTTVFYNDKQNVTEW